MKNSIHSQFINLDVIRALDPGPQLTLHPLDARALHVREGEMLRVFNERGELRLPAHLDYGIRPGCVSTPNGRWIGDGGTVNFLSAARETDMGHGAAFHDNVVWVEKDGR